MSSILVVGGNRGIGLALVQEIYHRHPSATIFATTRNPSDSDELASIAAEARNRIIIIKLDMVDETSVKEAVAEVSKMTQSLDHVYINAGVFSGANPITEVQPADLVKNFEINVVGPHNVLKAVVPLVLASRSATRTISVTSSLAGSVAALPEWIPSIKKVAGWDENQNGAYAVSKTAVNSLSRHWADYLEPKGIAVIAVHPGIVATRMVGEIQHVITPAESAKGFVDAVESVTIGETAKGIHSYDGKLYPW